MASASKVQRRRLLSRHIKPPPSISRTDDRPRSDIIPRRISLSQDSTKALVYAAAGGVTDCSTAGACCSSAVQHNAWHAVKSDGQNASMPAVHSRLPAMLFPQTYSAQASHDVVFGPQELGQYVSS